MTKYASVKGGLQLTMDLNIDPITVSKISIFTIGFQARQGLEEAKKEEVSVIQDKDSSPQSTVKARSHQANTREAVNPLGVTVISAELDKEDGFA